jgi:type I restriction enzyme R subunit
VAADYGFIIDGDYDYFKSFIDRMNLSTLPAALSISLMEKLNQGVYANPLEEWSNDGLEGRKLTEYEDIKSCADKFEEVVKKNKPSAKK